MSDAQKNSDAARPPVRPRPGARVPSNLRIRRTPDVTLSGADVGHATLPEEDLEDQRNSVFDGSRVPLQQPQPRTSSRQRSSPRRRLGVIERLAREDRRAAQRQQQRQDDSYSPKGASTQLPPEGISSDERSDERPRLFVRHSDARLPALHEVASPVEASSLTRIDEGTQPDTRSTHVGSNLDTPSHLTDAFATANSQTVAPQGDYFPVSSSSVEKKQQSLPPRKQDQVSVPTPLTERSETMYEDDDEHHAAEVADYLDVVDAEVGTLGYLTNIQNSIFVPHIPVLYDRRPVHDLPRNRKRSSTITSLSKRGSLRRGSAEQESRRGSMTSQQQQQALERPPSDLEQGRSSALSTAATGLKGGERLGRAVSRQSILTRMTSAVGFRSKKATDEETEYAKHIKEWRDMDEDERNELDEHVKLVLRKKAKIRRGLKGFWAFFKTPMGFIMTMYGLLITFWGTAIMLFIFNWIKVGERRRYWIEICDQILCALFAAVGLGFAPFRAVDTYRMIWIAKMHYRTWERRKALGLNDLQDPNDLPRPIDDGTNQVIRIGERGSSRHARGNMRRSNGHSDDIEMSVSGSGEASSPVQKPKHTPKHWWDLEKHDDESLTSGQRGLLSPQTSRVSGGSGTQHKKTKEGHFVVPEVPEEEAEGDVTGDLRKKTGHTQRQLKRNDSIKSELVKEREDIVVLTKEEQELLQHHQRKFHQSHSFYRFHETATHQAFPLDLMITIVCLLDCHSLLQGALGGCTWGIKYTHRPTALTASLISCSLSCNAVAGLLIYIGGRKTKKREEVERRLRIALEAMALEKIERRRARGELPDRPRGQQSASHDDAKNSQSSDGSGDDEQRNDAELQEAVDSAARETEDADQSQYDNVEQTPARQKRSSSLQGSTRTNTN